MSRMTKFLKQKATVTFVERDPKGDPKLDDHGDPIYQAQTVTVRCRRERSTKDVLTTGGAAAVGTTNYFFDNSISVDIGDMVDNKIILTVSDYINDMGISEGWMVTTS